MANEKNSKPTEPTIAPKPGKIVENSDKSKLDYRAEKKNSTKKDK